MSKGQVVKDVVQFLAEEKKYWLLPLVLIFALFGLIAVVSQSSAVAPFIYALF